MSFHRRVDTKVSGQLKVNTAVQIPQAAKESEFSLRSFMLFIMASPGKPSSWSSEVTGFQYLSPSVYEQYDFTDHQRSLVK